jgi:hypothetical protein
MELTFTKKARSISISPAKVQIPPMVSGPLVMYERDGNIQLKVTEDFGKMWRSIEEQCKTQADPTLPWNSCIKETEDGEVFRIKIEDRSMFFDVNSELLTHDVDLTNKIVVCIIHLNSVYNFKGMCGISCRVHQLKIIGDHQPVCML